MAALIILVLIMGTIVSTIYENVFSEWAVKRREDDAKERIAARHRRRERVEDEGGR
jgi:putative component of toxin-antitoxin plasmid stabilization module